MLKENNMEEQCIVTSFKQRSLVRIKKDDPDIVTGYIYSFDTATGQIMKQWMC